MAATSTTSATSRLVSAFSTTAAAAVSKSSPLLGRIASVPKEYPLAFGIVFSGLKTSFSDLLVQKVVEQREQVDWKRNAAFATFGFIYLGGVQYALYVPIFGRLFPTAAAFAAKTWRQKLHDARGMRNLCAQVFLDQCVHHPLLYFPAFYCTKELVMHENPDLRRVLGEYRQNMREDLKALWQIWVPATFFNFAFMPMWGRIPCVATTSLVWTCVLSAMRGGDLAHSEDMAGGAVTRATLNILEETIHGSRLFTQPIELQADKAHVVITAAGQDKTGWVAQLSRAVANAGGNISHSKMVRLGTDFIITMHTSVPFSDEQKLVASLKNNADLQPLHIQCSKLARRKTGMYEAAVMGVHLRCVGKDKPGMLASVAEALASRGLHIESITTNLQHRHCPPNTSAHEQAQDDDVDFVIDADCVLSRYLDQAQMQTLVQDLRHLQDELQLDTVDIRVQRLAEDPDVQRRKKEGK